MELDSFRNDSRILGIYIHIPYCKKKCNYCNFHFSTNQMTKDLFIDALLIEMELRSKEFPDHLVQSIYFGGGTPSVLNSREINKILETIHKYYNTTKVIEVCVEINPDDVNLKYLEQLKSFGINRLSIGIQSFFEEDLAWMNRNHSAVQSVQVIKDVIKAGFENYTIDLIYGIPSDNHDKWKNNLNYLVQYQIPHFSAYALTIEDNTVFAHQIKRQQMPTLDDQYIIDQMNILLDFAEAKEYEAYEISNFAKKNYRAIHNANYWKGFNYIGFGPSAHSYDGEQRSWNVSNNIKYIHSLQQKVLPLEKETLTYENRFNEFILLNIRKIEGINIQELEMKFPLQSVQTRIKLEKLCKEGHMCLHENNFCLTRKGRFISDYLASELFL